MMLIDGHVKIAMFITMGVFCVYGTAANSLVLYLKNKQKNQMVGLPRRPFKRHLLGVAIQSLSASHILFCSVAFPSQVLFNFIDITSSNWLCKLSWLLRHAFPVITINNLLVLSIEIYLSIIHPFVLVSARTAKSLAVAAWVAGILVVLMPMASFSWRPQTTGLHSYTLTCIFDKTIVEFRVLLLAVVVVNIILPAIALVFLSYRIMRFLRRRNAQNKTCTSQRNVPPTGSRGRAMTITVLLIFFLPFGLFAFVSILKSIFQNQDDFSMQYLFVLANSALAYLNAGICPTVLLLRQPDLQESLKNNIQSKLFRRDSRVRLQGVERPLSEQQAILSLAFQGCQNKLKWLKCQVLRDATSLSPPLKWRKMFDFYDFYLNLLMNLERTKMVLMKQALHLTLRTLNNKIVEKVDRKKSS